jgi:predicted  nucleic acid-binding Zn-ribbon protein
VDPGAIAISIPVVAIICATLVKIQKVKTAARNELPEEDLARLDALEHEVMTLRQELTETQERLDFTERLLSPGRETGSGGQ